uniref:Dolichyl-diphosphooligosaccharide--protein glycosyltransferase subunit DAD1 n=1 Tax=Buteo japonicus TaxID=224669 RepID=A0A8C0B628_9AVES
GGASQSRPFAGKATAPAQHSLTWRRRVRRAPALTGALQFGYCLGVGTFPFNSFLSGFISAVGSFILGVCLRIQINPQNKGEFQGISPERAFADFLFANTILHLVVINFVG